MREQEHWLRRVTKTSADGVLGLVSLASAGDSQLTPEQRQILDKARDLGADYVFFREGSPFDRAQAEALVYVDDTLADTDFAELHRRLWSWGVVPLVYRKRQGAVDLFRCAHRPEFLTKDGRIIYRPFKTLRSLAEIDTAAKTQAWWRDLSAIRNGRLWDDPDVCASLLSRKEASHARLYSAIRDLHDELVTRNNILPSHLNQRLVVLCLLIAYLEDRGILDATFFGRHKAGATEFFEVLADGEALVSALAQLEHWFNGDVFALSEADRDKILTSRQLSRFARLVQGRTDRYGQIEMWKLYSFRDLPIELISHIYQLFVDSEPGSVYTPPYLAAMLVEETMSQSLMDHILEHDESILDPSCGSGVFLVEAYKRLILHWRRCNDWARPSADVLKRLMLRVHGVDIQKTAIELAAFSLCLAMCEALDDGAIRSAEKLFPPLSGVTLHESCFFDYVCRDAVERPRALIGNPPFKSELTSDGETQSAAGFLDVYGFQVPDLHLPYLFLHEGLKLTQAGGIVCLLQQYSFLYNQTSLDFRNKIFESWNVREILDLTPIRGVFYPKDTRVLALVVEATSARTDGQLLHAVFRKTGRVHARRGFDIDYYDLHWVSLAMIRANPCLWDSNRFGGGRAADLMERLARLPTLTAYVEQRGWKGGEGFITGAPKKSRGKDAHVRGQKMLPSAALTSDGIEWKKLTTAPDSPIEEPRTPQQFTPPMLLIRENIALQHAYVSRSREKYLTYPDQIYGICAPARDARLLRNVGTWLKQEHDVLRAYVSVVSTKAFKKRQTALSQTDIEVLPYLPSGSLRLSPNDRVVAADILEYYVDYMRQGHKAKIFGPAAPELIDTFARIYADQLNRIYGAWHAAPAKIWAGVVCQPFVFGDADVDLDDGEGFEERLQALTISAEGSMLTVSRIVRVFEERMIIMIKPNRTRYWLPSIALRDADETLADLRAQGF